MASAIGLAHRLVPCTNLWLDHLHEQHGMTSRMPHFQKHLTMGCGFVEFITPSYESSRSLGAAMNWPPLWPDLSAD